MSAPDAMAPGTIALVTGACGGLGQVCARLLGRRHALALSDIDRDKVDALAAALEADGHRVVLTHGGDLVEGGRVEALVADTRAAGPLRVVVHTAGLSPALAPWDRILATNHVATETLLRALEAQEDGPLVAILIASIAGHAPQGTPLSELDLLLDAEPLAQDLIPRAAALMDALAQAGDPRDRAMMAYAVAKSANIRTCERRAKAWARAGRRILSVSPGLMRTRMGLRELEDNPAAQAMIDTMPMGMVSPLDIANVVDFLASDLASRFTGSDLRVDGGFVPAMRHP